MARVLAHHEVQAEGARPARNALLLHGILGSQMNLRSFARRLVEAYPQWRIVLPDLRAHGDSPTLAPPHTVEACAADLRELAQSLGLEPELICGHSFGGKVALAYAAAAPPGLRQVWVLD